MANNNQINNTDYYKLPCGLQLEDFIVAKCLSFPLGNALKYAWRAGKKDGESTEKDLKKRDHYVLLLERSIPMGYTSFSFVNRLLWDLRVHALVKEAMEWKGN